MLTQLLNSPEPIIRYKALVNLQGVDPASSAAQQVQAQIPSSPIVQALLSDRDAQGRIPFHPYQKWQGAHWMLTCLADTGYPPGDASLLPLRDQVMDWLFSAKHMADTARQTGQNRQVRLHASMEANAILACLRLGLGDEHVPALVERLLWAQWDDGGWNCDRKKNADTSSFHESLTPLRALAGYAAATNDTRARQAAERAAEVFLCRRLYRRRSDGQVIRAAFLQSNYPHYWQYDFLGGLVAMAEAGFIQDPRCQEALDLLESKQLPGGGWAAESRHYTVYRKPAESIHRGSRADWGPTGKTRLNEFVTVEALFVLRMAGRL